MKRKTEAAYQTILTTMGNKHFNNIELEVAWKLHEICIQSIITYLCRRNLENNEKGIRPNQQNPGKNNKENTNATTDHTNIITIHRDRAIRHNHNNTQK